MYPLYYLLQKQKENLFTINIYLCALIFSLIPVKWIRDKYFSMKSLLDFIFEWN